MQKLELTVFSDWRDNRIWEMRMLTRKAAGDEEIVPILPSLFPSQALHAFLQVVSAVKRQVHVHRNFLLDDHFYLEHLS